jgi:recombinational DNA repair ATPase RecF
MTLKIKPTKKNIVLIEGSTRAGKTSLLDGVAILIDGMSKRPSRKPGWLVFEVCSHVPNINSARSIDRTMKKLKDIIRRDVNETEFDTDESNFALHNEKFVGHKCPTQADWPESGT